MAAAAPLPCRGGAGGGVSNIKKRVQSSERPSFATAQLRKINKSSKKESSALGLFVRGPRTKSSRTADKESAHRAIFRLIRLRKPRRGGGVQPGGTFPGKAVQAPMQAPVQVLVQVLVQVFLANSQSFNAGAGKAIHPIAN